MQQEREEHQRKGVAINHNCDLAEETARAELQTAEENLENGQSLGGGDVQPHEGGGEMGEQRGLGRDCERRKKRKKSSIPV